jgi:hypothetical protein
MLYGSTNTPTRLSFQYLPIFEPFFTFFSVTSFGWFCKGLHAQGYGQKEGGHEWVPIFGAKSYAQAAKV